jgi:type VI protein secretion system component Hcp
MLPLLTEVITMAIKKNSSNAKKPNKVAAKSRAKLVAPKGQKVTSMKDMSFTRPVDKGSPVLYQG